MMRSMGVSRDARRQSRKLRRNGRGRVRMPAPLALIALSAACLLLSGCTSAGVGNPYTWDFTVIAKYYPVLLNGLWITMLLTVLSVLPAMLLGLVLAVCRMSKFKIIRLPFVVVIEFLRSSPALILIVWVYYCLPIVLGFNLPSIPAVVVALCLATGAYFAEAFRSGIESVRKELVEVGYTLGLSSFQRMRFVILPIAIRTMLPVLASTTVILVKDTTLVSVLGVGDLMYQANLISSITYRPLEVLTAVAVVYVLAIYPLTALSRSLERHLRRHLDPVKSNSRTVLSVEKVAEAS